MVCEIRKERGLFHLTSCFYNGQLEENWQAIALSSNSLANQHWELSWQIMIPIDSLMLHFSPYPLSKPWTPSVKKQLQPSQTGATELKHWINCYSLGTTLWVCGDSMKNLDMMCHMLRVVRIWWICYLTWLATFS